MGLRRIALRDFVIVSALELNLDKGFTVLTGETGAGKSILIDALQLVTGARADSGAVREGAERADISAEFDLPPRLLPLLEDAGFDAQDSLLLRRTVDLQGKSRAWVNGGSATAQQLRLIGEQLLDIHGQHAWQSLTRPDSVRGLLDAYAKLSTTELARLWQTWRQAQVALADAEQARGDVQRERERLDWQIGEVEKLQPLAHEWSELNASHARLSHCQSLLDAAQAAVTALDDDESSALPRLHAAFSQLQGLAHLEADFKDPLDLLSSSVAQLEDALRSLRSYTRRIEPDPEHLSALDGRIAQWISLARRYKCAPEELPAVLAAWKQELLRLDAVANLETLQSSEQQAHTGYLQEARRISKIRAQFAPQLAQSITLAMQDLGMQGGQFQVQLEANGQASPSGLEEVSFLVAGHAGSTPRPVGKVASGGELSRIALAIAVTTSQLGAAPTLIFDEVDSGVGGAIAQSVGRLMRRLGADRQVLAVTHLPQVAACADQHLLVAKQLQNGQTLSSVNAVHNGLRVAEIARMLGGERLSKTTLAHAQEMLQEGAAPWK